VNNDFFEVNKQTGKQIAKKFPTYQRYIILFILFFKRKEKIKK